MLRVREELQDTQNRTKFVYKFGLTGNQIRDLHTVYIANHCIPKSSKLLLFEQYIFFAITLLKYLIKDNSLVLVL